MYLNPNNGIPRPWLGRVLSTLSLYLQQNKMVGPAWPHALVQNRKPQESKRGFAFVALVLNWIKSNKHLSV